MPVITPAYPSMCATYNVTRSTMGIIQQEIERALDLTMEIMEGKRPWSDMFIKHTFFTKDYKYYMSVISASKTEEHQKIWSGWIESRVRLLVSKLERAPGILHARPFVKSFERRHRCTSEQLHLVQDGSLDFLAPPKKESEPDEAAESTSKTAVDASGEKSGDGASIVKENGDAPVKDEGEQGNGATADRPAEASDAAAQSNGTDSSPPLMEVFTTTQYIGLELNPGMFYSLAFYTGICFSIQSSTPVCCDDFIIANVLTQ